MHATVDRFLLNVVGVRGHDRKSHVAVHDPNVMRVQPPVGVTHITVKGFQNCRNTRHTFGLN